MRGFYVSAVNPDARPEESRPMIACGPFRTREEAARYVAPVEELTAELDPVRAPFLDFGVAAMDCDPLPEAPGNERFGLAVLDGYVLTLDSLLSEMTATPAVRS
jgi:hypothetical protein